jgi:ABC-type tungstate transport system substrate-binding protein
VCARAYGLIAATDPALLHSVALSLQVSLTACAIGALFGLLLGGWLAAAQFPRQRLAVWGLNAAGAALGRRRQHRRCHRVMSSAIALECRKGDLPLALALGVVLLALVTAVNGVIALLQPRGTGLAREALG